MIDTHCHLDFTEFNDDIDIILRQSKRAGIKKFILPSVGETNWQNVLRLSEKYKIIYPAFGIHPWFVDTNKQLLHLSNFLNQHSCIAIGECGLDFHKNMVEKKLQKITFQHQLNLAQQYQLPVIIHSLKAVAEVLKMVENTPIKSGVLHSFRGSVEQAKQAIKLNLYIGIDVSICNPNAYKLHKLVQNISIENILLETDSPDQKLKNQLFGNPKNIIIIAKILAKLHQTDTESILLKCYYNAQQCFDKLPREY